MEKDQELTQLTQLSMFLRERDEKRYKKYYEEVDPAEEKIKKKPESKIEKQKKIPQYNKVQEIKAGIIKNRQAGYKITDDFLYKNFDQGIVDGLMRSGQLIKQGNGEYVWK